MEIERKYYTPTEDEFHEGFEYEIYEESWHKLKYSYLDVEKMNQRVRVKVLDEEDLTSLGINKLDNKHIGVFNEDYILKNIPPEYGYYLCATIHLPIFPLDERLEYRFTKIFVHRYFENGMEVEGEESLKVFEGEIKNKSELIKVLKILGIWRH